LKMEKYVKEELEKTQAVLEKMKVKEEKIIILAMDKKTMVEIKNYANPPPIVRRIMTAALLLLRVDEGVTTDWRKVQKLCNPDGRDGMIKRLMNFDPNKVNPEIAKRVRELLKYITLMQAQKASPGAGTFYVWAKRVIGDDPDEANAPAEGEREGSRQNNDEQDNNPEDDQSILDETDEYEERMKAHHMKEEEQKRREEEHKLYLKNLPKQIAKEKEIFALQEEEERELEFKRRNRPRNQASDQERDRNSRDARKRDSNYNSGLRYM